MAWVGFAENDENKTVRPVASAGYDDGYLDQAGNNLGRDGKGQRTDRDRDSNRENQCLRKMLSKTRYSNPGGWRRTRRGYASSIALPLIVERKVIGALTIYASEPDAFDEEEVGFPEQVWPKTWLMG